MDQRIYTKKQVDALLNGMERKAKRKIVAVTFLMFFICANSVFNTVKLVQLCADFHDELERIENNHADVVLNPMERSVEGAATDVKAVSNGETTEIDTPRESRTVTMSGYTSRVEETDDSPCISADGTNICEYEGCVVASNDYALGTVIEVEGFGRCTVKDRMNGRYTGTNTIDMYFGMDLQEAINFGRQQIEIAVLS